MPQSTNHLVATNVFKHVTGPNGQLTILHDINISIGYGESVAIIGPSGSGKSTLLGLLAGLDLPSQGEIWMDNQCISQLSENQRSNLRKGHVGFVFQSFHLLPGFTALENAMLPLELSGDKNAQQKAKFTLEQVGLSHRAHHYPRQLSGGEQQRVAIARAFAHQPKLLFADELTGNLDDQTGATVSELLFQLNKENNTTLVLVTHDLELASNCERMVRLHNGEFEDDAVLGEKNMNPQTP